MEINDFTEREGIESGDSMPISDADKGRFRIYTSRFASALHEHIYEYAPLSHNHDELYASLAHNHDEDYVPLEGYSPYDPPCSLDINSSGEITSASGFVRSNLGNLFEIGTGQIDISSMTRLAHTGLFTGLISGIQAYVPSTQGWDNNEYALMPASIFKASAGEVIFPGSCINNFWQYITNLRVGTASELKSTTTLTSGEFFAPPKINIEAKTISFWIYTGAIVYFCFQMLEAYIEIDAGRHLYMAPKGGGLAFCAANANVQICPIGMWF